MLLDHDPEQVKQLAEDILGRDEFRAPIDSVLERIVRWIIDRLPESTGGGGVGGVPGVFTLVLLLLAIGVLVWVARSLLRQPRRRRKAAEPPPEAEVVVHRSATQWEAAAARHEAAGEWKAALRCRFAGLVQELTEDGVVAGIPGRTAGELRVEVLAARPEAARDFGSAAELFERAWYGDLPTGPAEASRFADHARRVLEAA